MEGSICIREAEQRDAAAIAHVHITSSRSSYAPLSPNWQGVSLADRIELWASVMTRSAPEQALFVAEHASEGIVAFAHGGPSRREDALAAVELYVFHVLPAYRRRGIGDRVWQSTCDRLRGTELRAMCLETFAELPCCRFYEAHGGEIASSTSTLYWGTAVTELIYLWAGLSHSECPKHGDTVKPKIRPRRLEQRTEYEYPTT